VIFALHLPIIRSPQKGEQHRLGAISDQIFGLGFDHVKIEA
jgi:hypothetical protein